MTIDSHCLGHKYFEDTWDIVLGFGTDGVGPFCRQKATYWPLLMFNYNLPPTECCRDKNMICLGEVPRPCKLKDMDSFLYPATQELLLLAVGVEAWDAPFVPSLLQFLATSQLCQCSSMSRATMHAHHADYVQSKVSASQNHHKQPTMSQSLTRISSQANLMLTLPPSLYDPTNHL